MEIIIDTGVVIAGEKGAFDLETWVSFHAEDQLAIAAVTVAELWHGVERASAAHLGPRQRYIETFISTVVVLPYTDQTAYEHARIWASLESSGKMIGYYDLIVAATGLERGCPVATFNKRHFSQVEGLTLIEPAIHGDNS